MSPITGLWTEALNLTTPAANRDLARAQTLGQLGCVAPIEIRTGALAIGDIVLVTVGAEIYTKIGWKIKEMTPMNKTKLVTMTNGKAPSGYIPDAESFLTHLTFEVLGSNLVPGSCAEDGISGNITALASE
ncbi:hypothetical protein LQW54_012377 [Pestalotiopsis sp. IQ-011]